MYICAEFDLYSQLLLLTHNSSLPNPTVTTFAFEVMCSKSFELH